MHRCTYRYIYPRGPEDLAMEYMYVYTIVHAQLFKNPELVLTPYTDGNETTMIVERPKTILEK